MVTTRLPAVRIGLFTAAVFACLSSVQAQTNLRWKFKEGEKLNFTTEQKTVMKMNVNGMDFENTISQMMDTSWMVKKVSDGVADITYTIDRLRMKMESGFGGFEYDSKDGNEPEGPLGQLMGPVLTAMVGAEIDMKTDPLGDLSDVKVPEKLASALQANPALGQFGPMFSEAGLKQMISQTIVSLPKESLSKGKKWSKGSELKLPMVGTVKIENEYTYQGPTERNGKKLEKIEVKVEQTITPADDAMVEIKVKSQDSKGTIYFDPAAGRMTEYELNQKAVMEVNVMGMAFEQAVEGTTTTRLAGSDAAKKSN